MAHIEKTRWAVIGPLLDPLLDIDPDAQAIRLEQIGRASGSISRSWSSSGPITAQRVFSMCAMASSWL